MKLIWHIIRKDILRDRWSLVVWALLFVGQVAIGVVLRHDAGTDKDWVMKLQTASFVLVGLQAVAGYVLVARLVHADPLIGTSMFWVTRPVSAARLLAAKALGALLFFGLLPVLLLLPWWLYCDFGWRDVALTALETLGWQLLVIAPAFLVGSLTDDPGRVLMWTLLLVLGLLGWLALLDLFGDAITVRHTQGLQFTRLWLAGATLVTGSLIIVLHQYLTRRFVRSVLIMVGMLGLVVLVGICWPWDWTNGFVPAALKVIDAPASLADQITLSVWEARATGSPVRPPTGDRVELVRLDFEVQGLPDDLSLIGDEIDHTWRWTDGPSFTRDRLLGYDHGRLSLATVVRKQFSLPVPQEDAETRQWYEARRKEMDLKQAARGLAQSKAASIPPVPTVPLLTSRVPMPPSIVARIRTNPPAYEAKVHAIIVRPEILMEMPIRLNARGSSESQTFQVMQLTRLVDSRHPARETGRFDLRILHTAPSVDRNGLWQIRPRRSARQLFGEGIMAVNRVTGDMIWLGEYSRGTVTLVIGGVVMGWGSFRVSPRVVMRGDRFIAQDPQWLEHTSLVMLTGKAVGGFTRVV